MTGESNAGRAPSCCHVGKMKRFAALLICIGLIGGMAGCAVAAPADGTGGSLYPPSEDAEPGQDKSADSANPVNSAVNSAKNATDDFELYIFSDRQDYKTNDVIKIWSTLIYAGDMDEITIWSGEPYIQFAISDGKGFDLGAIQLDVLKSTVLEKDTPYHFNYQKSGGWDASAPDAEFWDEFFSYPELILPAGEYTVTVRGVFSQTEGVAESVAIESALKITVDDKR